MLNAEWKTGGGFSLVEVVLAMGIFAFAVVAILGLVPGLLGQSKQSWQETRSAHIARQIVEDLNSGEDTNGFLIKNGDPNSEHLQKIDLTKEGSFEVTYDREGNPVPEGSKDIGFRAKLTVSPDALRIGLSNVTVKVLKPDDAANSNGIQFFTKVAALSETDLITP